LPTITSLEGSVLILGNCAEGTANSSQSGEDESVMVLFEECIDQIVIEYGTGTNSPTSDPDYSNITIGFDSGLKTEVCEHLCLPVCVDTINLVGMQIQQEHFEASMRIQSNQRINTNNQEIIYDAGVTVELEAGFEIMSGSVFRVFIEGCDN